MKGGGRRGPACAARPLVHQARHPERSEGSGPGARDPFAKRAMFVYIMTNRSGTLYVGVTNDIARRVREHRDQRPGSFTTRYRLDRLVYVEQTESVRAALVREKQLKGWVRRKKLALIATTNPTWADLATSWFEEAATAMTLAPEPDPSLRSG